MKFITRKTKLHLLAALSCGAGPRRGAALTAPHPTRTVAIGDVHGDLAALRSCLRVAGVVDIDDFWIAEPGTALVSCGDVLDRGTMDWECLEYLGELRRAARIRRGDVHLVRSGVVLGNHEVLNVLGDLRFVDFDALHSSAAAFEPNRVESSRDNEWAWKARARAFAPGGAGCELLAELCGDAPVARRLGDTLFCHGGLHVVALTVGAAARRKRRGSDAPKSDAAASALLDALNLDAAEWLAGNGPLPAALGARAAVWSPSSPVWSRAYSHPAGSEPSRNRCGDATAALDALGCERMVGELCGNEPSTRVEGQHVRDAAEVVGHTPQINAGINACCAKRVYRIDTGLSSFYGGPRQVLEILPGQEPTVLSATPSLGGFL